MAVNPPTLLHRRQIDEARWNDAVNRDDTYLPYGLTWWLDALLGDRWGGLVLDDYRIVLPLPYSHRLGSIRRVASAPFTQQCGPWGNPSVKDTRTLFTAIPGSVVSVDIGGREGLAAPAIPTTFTTVERTNLILDLGRPHEDVRRGYHKSVRRKLRKAGNEHRLRSGDASEAIETFRSHAGLKAGLRDKHYRAIVRLIEACTDRGVGRIYALDDQDGALLATGFFPMYRGRAINIFPASTPLGYRRDGMIRLLDGIFATGMAGCHTFDFEGSDDPGIARFFRNFGPIDRPYHRLTRRLFG